MIPREDVMVLTRRSFMARSASAVAAASYATGVNAQSANDTIRIAFAARGNRTLDPAASIQGADNWSITHIHDVLVTSPPGRFAEKPDEFVPQLAKSWSMSPDARTWTFQLREGVQFHKGYGECTSEDVAFSIDRARDPKQGGGNRSLFENIVDVKANGKYTVVVTLRQPDPCS